MGNRISHRKWFLILAASLVIILGCAAAILRLMGGGNQRVVEVASRLGYTRDAEIAQMERCWDIFSHCGVFLYFRTGESVDDFALRLNGLEWKTDFVSEVSGYNIFTEINMHTKDRLTMNGSDALGDRSGLPTIYARQWTLTSPGGGKWTISHYSLAEKAERVALNGTPLNANIISLMYQTK